ncbi:MAG: chemotaxis protein CheX [Candidatus Aureabacteria bacterium]|nr:chemotaxis protein CheX [Candidatus Auribacterota bacterium]
MDIKFFGQYLLEKNIITKVQLLEAITLQTNTNISLPILAVKLGYIDKSAHDKIQQYQIRNNLSFIEAAKQLQLISSEKLEHLIARQVSNNILLGEALVRKNILSQEQVDEHFRRFRTEQSALELEILSSISSHHYGDIIGASLQSSVNLFRYAMDVQPRIGAFYTHTSSSSDQYPWVAFQSLQGDYNFTFHLYVTEPLICQIASSLVQRRVDDINELSLDAMKEFVNTIVGYICTTLSIKNIKEEPTLPEIERTEKMIKTNEMVKLVLRFPEEVVEIGIIFHE